MAGRAAADEVLRFSPRRQESLWGTENWEISPFPGMVSIVSGGKYDGKRLDEVVPEFPFIVKTIDARQRLSVQVHPSEATADISGGVPKTEFWVMLDDGVVYAGFKSGVQLQDVEKALYGGTIEECLVRHEVSRGEAFLIPGGMVHTIGSGLRIYEVQQCSDTTFRLYDWGRVDEHGRQRVLHIDSALKAIDFSLPPPVGLKDIKCGLFDFRQCEVHGRSSVAAESGPIAFYAAEGNLRLDGIALASGTSVLVPKGMEVGVEGEGKYFLTQSPAGGPGRQNAH